jgi:hypothetical protein
LINFVAQLQADFFHLIIYLMCLLKLQLLIEDLVNIV